MYRPTYTLTYNFRRSPLLTVNTPKNLNGFEFFLLTSKLPFGR